MLLVYSHTNITVGTYLIILYKIIVDEHDKQYNLQYLI